MVAASSFTLNPNLPDIARHVIGTRSEALFQLFLEFNGIL